MLVAISGSKPPSSIFVYLDNGDLVLAGSVMRGFANLYLALRTTFYGRGFLVCCPFGTVREAIGCDKLVIAFDNSRGARSGILESL
jgi:hypothetical protein